MNRSGSVLLLVLALVGSQLFSLYARAEEPEGLSPVVTVLGDVYVQFKVRVFGLVGIVGRFERMQGEVTTASDGTETGVRMHIDVASVTTDDSVRDAYLRGDSFFEAVRYPHIVFAGSCQHGSGQSSHIVGNMSLHGVTRPVVFRVEPIPSSADGDAGGYLATTVIRRSEFGLHSLKYVIADKVEIVVAMGGGTGG